MSFCCHLLSPPASLPPHRFLANLLFCSYSPSLHTTFPRLISDLGISRAKIFRMTVGGISEPDSESVHVSASTSASASVTASPSSSTVASPSGKRSRDPEDEVYVDNLHSHKRYLSEIMASSLNGLSVGDPLPENLEDSPARSDNMFYLRDELPLQYSPMSEDLDECRYYESNACSPSQPDSQPTSPVSPYRFQRLAASTTFSPGPVYPGAPAVTPSQARQRGSETEGRFPSSPSDICHSADLRRAALLRSVQMRTQPMGSSQFEAPYSPMQDVQPCPFIKSLVQDIDSECPMHEKSCRLLTMNMKGDDESTLTMNMKGDDESTLTMNMKGDDEATD